MRQVPVGADPVRRWRSAQVGALTSARAGGRPSGASGRVSAAQATSATEATMTTRASVRSRLSDQREPRKGYMPRRASMYGTVRRRIFTSVHRDQPATYT